MAAPGVDVHLDALPADINHAAPQVGFAVAVPVVRQPLHGGQVGVVIPGGIGVVHAIAVEEVFVVVERQAAVILGQAVLFAVGGEEGVILRRVPIVQGRAIQIGLHVGPQVERVALLRPDREEGAAAREDVGHRAGLEIGQHLLLEVLRGRVNRVEDLDVGMGGVELVEHLLGHRGEPVGAPILVDQLHLCAPTAAPGNRRWGGGRTGRQGRAGSRRAGQTKKPAAGEPRWIAWGVMGQVHVASLTKIRHSISLNGGPLKT